MPQAPYVIVGGGPAGMCLARAFVRFGVPFLVIERHSDVGGIWDPENDGSPMYRSAHFISSKTQSGYVGFPMPDHFADYPSNRQILDYHRAFADTFDLRRHVRFDTSVQRATRDDGGWLVELSDGEILRAAGIVCANGTNWDPLIPSFDGEFTGEIRHSVTYRSASEFDGKRVLVVGAGNSGCDIACDAAQHAEAAFISMRRGYHFIPKHIFGMPADVFAANGPKLPMRVTQPIFGVMLRLLVGDLTKLGLVKPDHKIFETHPILNDQLLHHLRHGDIAPRRDIARFDGNDVVFTDGRRETIDLVILATGYAQSIPYVPQDALDWVGTRPKLYLNLVSRKTPDLMAMGFMETDGGAYKMFDEMANVLAQYAADRLRNPARAAQFVAMTAEDPDLSGGVRYVNADRNGNYVQHDAYLAELARVRTRMGWQDVDATALAGTKVR